MTKPYDLKALGDAIIAQARTDGLALADQAAEAVAKSVYIATKQWVKDSAAMNPGIVDDLVVKYIDQLDGFVLPEIAKLEKLGQ